MRYKNRCKSLADIAENNGDIDTIAENLVTLNLDIDHKIIESIAEKYSKAILGNIENVLWKLNEPELNFLKDLCDHDEWRPMRLMFPSSVSLFLADYQDFNDGTCRIYLTPDFKEAASPVIDKLLKDQSFLDKSLLEQTIIGMTNTYGIVKKSEIVRLLTPYSEMISKESKARELKLDSLSPLELFWSIYDDSAALQLARNDSIPASAGDFYMCSRYVDDFKIILDERKSHPEFKTLKRFSLPQYIEAGDDLFPLIPNPEDEPLLDFMTKDLKIVGGELVMSMILIWINRQEDFDFTSDIKMLSYHCHSQQKLEKAIELMQRYLNAMPIWGFKGHSSNDSIAKTGKADISKIHLIPGRNLIASGITSFTPEMEAQFKKLIQEESRKKDN